jgi:hypothetical protein
VFRLFTTTTSQQHDSEVHFDDLWEKYANFPVYLLKPPQRKRVQLRYSIPLALALST